jgi:hypothetical protein
MTNSQTRIMFRLCLAFLIGLGITSSQWVLAPSRSAPVIGLNLKTASQISSEANSYDNAIRDLSAINLSTLTNLKMTQDILEAQVPKLRFGRTKLLSIALGDSTFIGAVRAKVFDKRSAENFAFELAQQKEAINDLSGASALRNRISTEVSLEVMKLKKLAQLFKENAETLNKRAQLITTVSVAIAIGTAAMSTAVVVAILIAAAMVAVPALTGALVSLAAGGANVAAGLAQTAVSATAVAIIAATASTAAAADQAQDKVAECADKADSKYKKCNSSAHDLIGPLVGIALEECKAKWVFDAGECLLHD